MPHSKSTRRCRLSRRAWMTPLGIQACWLLMYRESPHWGQVSIFGIFPPFLARPVPSPEGEGNRKFIDLIDRSPASRYPRFLSHRSNWQWGNYIYRR